MTEMRQRIAAAHLVPGPSKLLKPVAVVQRLSGFRPLKCNSDGRLPNLCSCQFGSFVLGLALIVATNIKLQLVANYLAETAHTDGELEKFSI